MTKLDELLNEIQARHELENTGQALSFLLRESGFIDGCDWENQSIEETIRLWHENEAKELVEDAQVEWDAETEAKYLADRELELDQWAKAARQ